MSIRQRIYLHADPPGPGFISRPANSNPDEGYRVLASGPEHGGWEVVAQEETDFLTDLEARLIAGAAIKYVEAFKEHPTVTTEWQALRAQVDVYKAHR